MVFNIGISLQAGKTVVGNQTHQRIVQIDMFEDPADAGIDFRPATEFAPELLVPEGLIGGRSPTPQQLRDIEFGWQLAKAMGRLDVGQSVCVKDQAVLAVEAIEGTDACIGRAGGLCKKGGFTVVKVAKPQQDMRFDVPTIGLGTVRTLIEAGGQVLAVEADKTILVEREEVLEFAARHRLRRGLPPSQLRRPWTRCTKSATNSSRVASMLRSRPRKWL